MNRRRFLLTALQHRPSGISKERRHQFHLYNATITKFALGTRKFDGLRMQKMEEYINRLIDLPGTTDQEAAMLCHCYHIATYVAEART